MAWLSGLADRAEDILNRMDQNAAAVLVQPQHPPKEVICRAPENTPEKSGSTKLDDFVVFSIEQELTQQGVEGNKEELADTKRERDALKTEVSNLLDQIHNRNNGRHRLEVEKEISELREANCSLVEAHRELRGQCEKHIQSISELKLNLSSVQEQLNIHREEEERVNQELISYRSRAQGLLQLKERIIEEMRSTRDHDKSSVVGDTLSGLEIEQLQSERKEYLAELAAMQLKVDAYQQQQINLDKKLTDASHEYEANLQRISSEFTTADEDRKLLRREMAILTTELQAVRLQSTKSNEKMVQILHEKDQELRKRATAPQTNNDSLESRILSLTQSLIQKQSSLEGATADRNSLKMQLEKIEAQYRNLSLQVRRDADAAAVYVHSMTDDDKVAQLPAFMQEHPFDNQMAKRMKRAIKASDNLLDTYLRRYPLLRIFTFFYILLLHIWVLVVLMSSTPY